MSHFDPKPFVKENFKQYIGIFAEGMEEFKHLLVEVHIRSKVKPHPPTITRLKEHIKVFNHVGFWIPGFRTKTEAVIIRAPYTSVLISF